MNAVVIGAAGFTGGELLRLLLGHPEVNDLVAVSRSAAGKAWGAVHPGVAALTSARFADLDAARAARGRDVVFLALEHGASTQIMGDVLDAKPGLVIDLSADFRVGAPGFTYALADDLGRALRGKTQLAIPGCFATAALLALKPLVRVSLSAPPVMFGITGSSGAGTQPKESTHHPRRASNVQAYSVLGHRHEAEIAEHWRAWTGPTAGNPRLLTHQGPFVRGISLTLHARGRFGAAGHELLALAYEGSRFVRIAEEPPALTHVVGTNLALIHAATSKEGDEIAIHVAIDNLVKGAGGQAIQAMNLALGLPEDAGLPLASAYPC